MPSVQWTLVAGFPPEKFTAIGVNYTSSTSWLLTYSGQTGISFPFVYDSKSSIFSLYQVGSSFGNIPPTYVIIDTSGIVRYRIDNTFYKIEEMSNRIKELLGQ